MNLGKNKNYSRRFEIQEERLNKETGKHIGKYKEMSIYNNSNNHVIFLINLKIKITNYKSI